ncbi:hypothetical protein [uncultured Methylobacterium sp.]|uniref:hypothetical protein n=1 Tax=uncultured Methylobacterium sp. TaxID=157278 RepID=UPI0035CA048D
MTASANQSSSTVLPSISAQRIRKEKPGRQRDPRGDRYNRAAAYMPGVGLASAPQAFGVGSPIGQPGKRVVVSRSAGHATVAVDDPYEPGKRVQATVNRRVDLLEDERSHGRISVSQYEIGRQVQAVFEKASGARSGSGVWGVLSGHEVPRDTHGLSSQEVSTIRAITDAQALKNLMTRIERAIGPVPTRMLRELLGGAGTFKGYAEARGMAGDRKASQVADRFRFLLEALDETFAARGLLVRDKDGEALIRAETGVRTGEETDDRGRVVPAGHGYRWGRQITD